MADYDFSNGYLTDQEIVDLSFDKLRRTYAFMQYPFLSKLQDIDASGDIKHFWMNSVEGLVTTQINDSGGTTGGATSETITVDSSDQFKVNHTAYIAHDGTDAGIQVRITAIPSSTTMTISTVGLSGANLASYADNTYIILSGDWVNYGVTIEHILRLPTRTDNVIEQISIDADIPKNVAKANGMDGQSVETYLWNDAMSQFKQKATMAALFGYQSDPSAGGNNAGKGKMDGLYNIVPSANRRLTENITKANVRGFIFELMYREAFQSAGDSNANWCVCNGAFVEWFMSLDDSNTGISQKTTDSPFRKILLGGVWFTVLQDMGMTRSFPVNKPAAFFLTARENNKRLVKWARIPDDEADGKPQVVLKEAVKYTLQLAQFGTIEVMDNNKQGLFVAANTI